MLVSRHFTLAGAPSFWVIPLLLALVFQLPGCSSLGLPKPKTKTPKEEARIKKRQEAAERIEGKLQQGDTVLVGDLAYVSYTNPIQILGFGLVVGLPGTGTNDKPGEERNRVLREMQKMNIPKAQEMLASNTTAIVRIEGILREGIGIGEKFDIRVMTPPDSETSSLRGGWLMKTNLAHTEFGDDGMLRTGRTIAVAEGPILVNPSANARENPGELKRGKVLGGGVTLEGRFLCLVMKPDAESEIIADRIAKEINHRFFVPGNQKGIATAKTETLIELQVPPHYRNNIPRFTRIVQSVAMYDSTQRRLERLERLKKALLIPRTSVEASYQLEAIGVKAIPALKPALESKSDEVRLNAAVALAYLGDSSAARVLAELARNVPEFRVFALDALSIMKNDFDAESELRELLHESSAETRYGAFRALWYRNELDPVIRGENLGGQFSYHGVVTKGPPMVHITNSKRPELVLFSPDIRLQGSFALNAGPRILAENTSGGPGASPDNVTVTRFVSSGVDQKRQVGARLDDVIRAIVELGGTYPDVIQMLHEAEERGNLPCKLEIDKLPEGNRVYKRPADEEEEEIAETGKKRTFLETINPMTWVEKNRDKKAPDFYRAIDNDPRE